MSESSGAQDASTLVLCITVPAGAEYHAIVKELAGKVAAYLGDTDPEGVAAGIELDRVASAIVATAGSRTDEDMLFEFRQTASAMLIRARVAGRAVDAWCALPSRT
jgi:hypothetical protein